MVKVTKRNNRKMGLKVSVLTSILLFMFIGMFIVIFTIIMFLYNSVFAMGNFVDNINIFD